MKTVAIMCCLFGVAMCNPLWGHPQQVHDTPEVAAAKAEHFAAHDKARYGSHSWGAQDRSWNGPSHDDGDDGSYKDDGSWRNYDDGSYKGEAAYRSNDDGSYHHGHHGQQSWGTNDDGSYKGDHSARNYDDGSYKGESSWQTYDDGSWKDDTHLYNHHGSHQAAGHWDGHEKKWTGPIALPPGYDKHGAPLQVLDTPEVEAAKAKHFQLYHAAAHGAYHHHY